MISIHFSQAHMEYKPHTGHKATLNRFQRTEIMQCMFSEHRDGETEQYIDYAYFERRKV